MKTISDALVKILPSFLQTSEIKILKYKPIKTLGLNNLSFLIV